VQARVYASRSQHAQAETLAREAVAITARTDALNIQGDALCDLAEVLHAAGRSQAADDTYAEAAARYERKHNLAQVEQVRERLAELHHVGLST
jgi:thioredoxin-like negative regulator of GroEL